MSVSQTSYTKDLAAKQILVSREFNAPVNEVWKAWTHADILEKWWAPKPYKAVTVSMNFCNEGRWLYYMLGPEGDKQYCAADFNAVITGESYAAVTRFCDENGTETSIAPVMNWQVFFTGTAKGTLVEVKISFASETDLETIIQMGFQEGFAMAHGNLDEYFAGG